MRTMELFAGAGGMASGTERAGFRHEALVEFDPAACETLRSNRPDWPVLEIDVRHVDFARYTRIDLLTAGAPCQPFSTDGKRLLDADPRNMFPEVLRAVHTARPSAVLLENVSGMLKGDARAYFDWIINRLGEFDYDAWWRRINCADHGVPQRRERVFVVGFRRDLGVRWAWPTATHGLDALLHAQWTDGSYWTEHGLAAPEDPPLAHIERLERLWPSRLPPPRLRWRTVRDVLPDPGAPRIASWRVPKGHDAARVNAWDEPACTIMTRWNTAMVWDGNGDPRLLTMAEIARLQTFPDDWALAGRHDEQLRQLGNAVPPDMAYILGRAISHQLRGLGNSLRLTANAPVG
jgi:DNA (cytosine-5)-methyltransferase 1